MRSIATHGGLERLLDAAVRRISRLEPVEAFAAARAGALLIDIRSDGDRGRHGIAPGSLHIPRTVLEWRVAPDSEWRNPLIVDVEQQLILICDHGCSSALAAAALVDLGFARAGDVLGGYAAWRAAGLPWIAAPAAHRAPGELAGMGGPDN